MKKLRILPQHKQSKRCCSCTSLLLVSIVGYKYIYVNKILIPKQTESLEAIWRAENKAFDEQNWNEAINGDSLGLFDGLKSK